MSDKTVLYSKLVKVMESVSRIPKNGKNAHFGYKFVTEGDVSDSIRAELIKQNVAIFVASELIGVREGKTGGGKPTQFSDVKVTVTFACGDTGEHVSITSTGMGDDPSDKATPKAITSAVKYALMKTFLIPTGDDIEHASPHQMESKPAKADRKPPKPAADTADSALAKELDKQDNQIVEAIGELATLNGKQRADAVKWAKGSPNKPEAFGTALAKAAEGGVDRDKVEAELTTRGLEAFMKAFDAVEVKA